MTEVVDRSRLFGSSPADYGDAPAEYRQLTEGVGIVRRTDRCVVRMWGKDPRKMLNGLATNDLQMASAEKSVYGAMLTPKGRFISDFRTFVASDGPEAEVIFDFPRFAGPELEAHLRKFIPPMFARWELADGMSVIGAYGPGATEAVSRVAGEDLSWDPDKVQSLEAGEIPFRALAANWTGPDRGWDLLVAAEHADRLAESLVSCGTPQTGYAGWTALETARVEAGRPRFGLEITEDTMPAEVYPPSGDMDRAVSFRKGCYTGQEVVVRLAHRGHVNRSLRGLVMEGLPPQPFRTALLASDNDKEVGWVTSSVASPRAGATVGMGYLRREVESGTSVRVGDSGIEARVTDLPVLPAS